jgi:hypothetical protein
MAISLYTGLLSLTFPFSNTTPIHFSSS